eukprot:TRINITY_DN64267_c0_g1_i1.p1 TRINITY_DN64267_c0_g1~~TRINITY_DN64267_c0_g1_i1.p1  ORF type:complete len:355 (-),score=18.44 TRINITY_DN64267_c0_g1_i1:12-1076(-)
MDLGTLLKATVAELRELCKQKGIADEGFKADLAQRLILHDSGCKRKRQHEEVNISTALEDDIRSKLDCPVCFELMLPPIRQCQDGHALCDACCNTLLQAPQPQCPICRTTLDNPVARALQLEQVAGTLRLACKWEGCDQVFAYGDYAGHLRTCGKRPINCPVKGSACWSGDVRDLRNHLKEVHDLKEHIVRQVNSSHTFRVDLDWSSYRQEFGGPSPWRPMILRIQPKRHITLGCCFAVRLWCPGAGHPYLCAVQRVGRDKSGHESQWTCTVEFANGRERLSWKSVVSDIDSDGDVWKGRPELGECIGKVFVIPQVQMACFNTSSAHADNAEGAKKQAIRMRLSFEKDVVGTAR